MYEALYNATSQSMSSDFDEFYVELLFYVDANGKVDSVNLHKSSGYDYIDNKMLQLSKRLVKRHKHRFASNVFSHVSSSWGENKRQKHRSSK